MREIKLGELKILFENLNKENDINNIKKLLNESYDVIIFYINKSKHQLLLLLFLN